MAYTNSPLVAHTKLSTNHSGQRTHSMRNNCMRTSEPS